MGKCGEGVDQKKQGVRLAPDSLFFLLIFLVAGTGFEPVAFGL